MTAAERKVARLQEKLRAVSAKLRADIDDARRVLQKAGCTHPLEYQEPYSWQHDTGYGVQRDYIGIKCGLCHATDHYRTSWGR